MHSHNFEFVDCESQPLSNIAAMKYIVRSLLAIPLLFKQSTADTHVLILPGETALNVTDEPQCGHMREAYVELFSQCAPTAVDTDLAHYVEEFEPIAEGINVTSEEIDDRRALRGDSRELKRKRRANCGNCRRNPDACCILGIYFHCSICIRTKKRFRRRLSADIPEISETDLLRDQFRLTTQLPDVSSKCQTQLNQMCAVKHAQGKSEEMECWGCTVDGTWEGEVEAYNVLSGLEGLDGEL